MSERSRVWVSLVIVVMLFLLSLLVFQKTELLSFEFSKFNEGKSPSSSHDDVGVQPELNQSIQNVEPGFDPIE